MRKQEKKISRIPTAFLTGSLLLGSLLSLVGSLLVPPSLASAMGEFPVVSDAPGDAGREPPLSPQAEASTEPATTATLISTLDTLETNQGVRILLDSDGPLPYQVFTLEAPPRLLLTFAGVRLGPAVQPRVLAMPGVEGLFPQETGAQSSQLEVVLTETAEYTVQERPNGLDLTVLSKHAGHAAPAPGAKSGQGTPLPHIADLQVSKSATGTRIRLQGQGPLPEPHSTRLFNPPQLIFDFMGVAGPASGRVVPVDSREITAVQLATAPGKTRLVMELTDPGIQYRMEQDEGLPLLHLTREAGQAQVPPVERSPQRSPQVETVAFSQTGATGELAIQTNSDTVVLDSRREEKVLTLFLKGTRLAERLSYNGTSGHRQDVRSFGGPVQTIDTYTDGEDTRVVVALSSPGDQHEIIQQGKVVLLRVKPAETAAAGGKPPVYTGAKVSMDFKGIDIHNALRLLAELNHLNLLVSDAVKGTVTMRLIDVPWDQALDLILETKGLGKSLQGNVLRVAPVAELQQMANAQLLARESRQKLEPVLTELMPVSFAKASEIRDLLMETDQGAAAAGATPPPPAAGQGAAQPPRDLTRTPHLLSPVGTVSVDQRTNTLIVKDMAANLAKIRAMVAKLDKPIPQVLIEARIVEIGRESVFGLGINWGFNYKRGTDARLGLSNSAANAYLVQQNAAIPTDGRRPLMTGAETPDFNVRTMPTGVASNLGIHLGSLSPLLDLDIELGALESNGKAKTISSPRVLTANNKEANISQGVRQPYQSESRSGGVTYQYIDAALSLKVTPHVTASGAITLEVTAKNNSIRGAIAPGAPPAIDTREVETQALVKDGQTIVLGGILQNTQREGESGIPELKELPLMGWLFKNRTTSSNQLELLVFITPRIVDHSEQAPR